MLATTEIFSPWCIKCASWCIYLRINIDQSLNSKKKQMSIKDRKWRAKINKTKTEWHLLSVTHSELSLLTQLVATFLLHNHISISTWQTVKIYRLEWKSNAVRARCWETGRLETDSRAISTPKLGCDSRLINNPHTNMEMKSKINDW